MQCLPFGQDVELVDFVELGDFEVAAARLFKIFEFIGMADGRSDRVAKIIEVALHELDSRLVLRSVFIPKELI